MNERLFCLENPSMKEIGKKVPQGPSDGKEYMYFKGEIT